MVGAKGGVRFGRRTLLVAVGSTLASPAQAEDLVITADADGGFTVAGLPGGAWQVPGATLRAAWGDAARPTIDVGHPDRLRVQIVGMLAGRSGAKLDLAFDRTAGGRSVWVQLLLPGVGRLQAGPLARWAAAPVLETTAGVVPWLRAAGLHAGAAGAGLRLVVDRRLRIAMRTARGFALAPGYRAVGSLVLLPGERPAADSALLSRIELDNPGDGGSIRLAAEGCDALAFAPRGKVVAVSAPGQMLLPGPAELSAGATRLNGEATTRLTLTRDPRGHVDWSLAFSLGRTSQAVATRHVGLELRGGGDVDITASGRLGAVAAFSGSAQPVHAALRLPLGGGAVGYAEVGRLDFDADAACALRFGQFGPDAASGQIPLGFTGSAPTRLPLKQATLWVVRKADLFTARFRFRGLLLEFDGHTQTLVQHGEPAKLIVQLPPQHLMEESFARQAPALPGELGDGDFLQIFDAKARQAVQDRLARSDASFARFSANFTTRYLAAAKGAGVPDGTIALEAIYVGADGLITPLGRRIARELGTPQPPRLADLELGLGPITIGDILRRTLPDPLPNPLPAPLALAAFGTLLKEAASEDADHALVQRTWRQLRPDAPDPFWITDWLASWPRELPAGALRDRLVRLFGSLPAPSNDPSATARIEQVLQGEHAERQPFNPNPAGRLAAGETRLVFRLNQAETARWEYSLNTLLKWDNLDLEVLTRARRFGEQPGKLGTGPSSGQVGEAALNKALEEQGFPPQPGPPPPAMAPRVLLVEHMQRLLAAASTLPSLNHTAIELPARLVLSPASDARFQPTPAPAGRGPVPLWRATLVEQPRRMPTLRAIASPDFRPLSLDRTGLVPCPAECVGAAGGRCTCRDTPEQGFDPAISPFHTALYPYDRHQLVALSSVHGMPVLERRGESGSAVAQASQIAPPRGHALDGFSQTMRTNRRFTCHSHCKRGF